MRKSTTIGIVVLLYSVLIVVAALAQVPSRPVDPEWVKYLDVIVPGVTYLFKALIWVIVALGTILINVLIYFGRKRLAVQNSMHAKLDIVYRVITSCNGCKDSLEKVAQGEAILHTHSREGDAA